MLVLLSVLAHADVAPPEGYVETCNVAQACYPIEGKTCSGWHGGREECEALEKEGWVRACKTRGASSWTEVFCKTAPTAAPTTPTKPPDEADTSRCAHVGFPGMWTVLVVALTAAGRRYLRVA